MVVFLDAWVGMIPMAALVAIMIMVSIGTFSWSSIKDIRTNPASSSIVMIATVLVTVFTHNLAYGVFVGVLLSALFFASKVGRILYISSKLSNQNKQRDYKVVGQVFFTSAEQFVAGFDFKEAIEKVTIDLSQAHFWDITAISSLDKVVIKFRREGTVVELVGLNEASATLVDKFAVHNQPDDMAKLINH